MKKTEQENPQEEPVTKEVKELPPEPVVKKSTVPSNLDLGDGYRSSSDPVIGAPLVEDRATGDAFSGVLDRIRSKVTGKETETKERTPRATVKVTKGKQNEFMELARTLLSPMLILAVGQSFGEVCAPTQDEADQFVAPLARIITRHVPMPDHMSADLIDILSIVSVSVIWYTRVSSDLPWSGGGGSDNKKPDPRSPAPSDDKTFLTKEEDQKVKDLVEGTPLQNLINGDSDVK